MPEHRYLRWFLSLLSISAFVHHAQPAGTLGSVNFPANRRLEPVGQANDPQSQVEYVNDGPLGPLYDFLIRMRLQRWCLLLRKANLESVLSNAGSLTIFAPTDGSFAFLPGGTLEELERNPRRLQEFLLHHFVSGDLSSTQITDEMVVDSLQGTPLKFNIYSPGNVITVSGAEILQPDLEFEMGRVHIIDRPIYPLPTTDILGQLQTSNREFYKLVRLANLGDFLSSGTYTVLAPDDSAFDYLSVELKDAMAANETLAYNIVLVHLLPSSIFVRGITNGMKIQSIGGQELEFTERRGLTFVNGVPIVTPDVAVTNGVVHVVNRVLLPEGVEAECHCKPLSTSRTSTSRGTPGTAQRRPFEPSRLRPTAGVGTRPIGPPAPGPGIRPAPAPSGVPGRRPGTGSPVSPQRPGSGGRTPGGQLPSITSPGQRPGSPVSPQRPGSGGRTPGGQFPSAPSPGQRPVTVPGRRPSVTPPRTGTGPRTPAPLAPGRVGQTPGPAVGTGQVPRQPGSQTDRPRIPGDVLIVDLVDEPEPDVLPPSQIGGPQRGRPQATRPSGRPSVTQGGTRPGQRGPGLPSQTQPTQRPSKIGRPSIISPLDDNTVDNQGRPFEQESYEPPDYPGETPIDLPRLQPGQRPGQQTPFQPGRRVGQQPQTPGQRPGQQPFQPGQRPGQQPFQPGQRPGQQPFQPGQRPGQQPFQPGQRPGQQPFQPGQRPGQQPLQPGQRPGQQPLQPGQRPGQQPLQPGQRPGQQPLQPGQRPGQQPFQPGQRPGQQPLQPGQRPGQQPFQPGQRPGQQPLQPGQRPGQQPFQPGQRPGQQPGHRPGQQPFEPGQMPDEQPFQPGQIPDEQPYQPGQIPGQQPFQPGQRPGQQPFQPGQRPGQQPFQPGQRPGQQPFQPGQRPGQQPLQPGQRPGQQPFQPGQRPGQQPLQPGQRPDQQPHQPGQRPDQQPHQPGQRPDQQPHQPGQRPGQQPYQPGQRPGQQPYQPGQRPGQQPYQPGQRPGQQPHQPGQRPGQQPHQPGQRPGQQPYQPGQRPGQQPFQPGQRPGQQPLQPGQRPGQQPLQPGQRPGQQPFQPGQRSGEDVLTQTGQWPDGQFGQPEQIPGQRPGYQPRVPAASVPTSGRPAGRPGTSLFPTQRPGTHPSESTKGQQFDPSRHRPQTQRGRFTSSPSNIPSRRSATPAPPGISAPRPSGPPEGSNRQISSCRRSGDRITPATQSLPLCSPSDDFLEPCQNIADPYDPSDPRPQCLDTYSCRQPEDPIDPSDTRPLCEEIQEQMNCKQQDEPYDPTDYRPLCSENIQPVSADCRQPHETLVAGDRRPLCDENSPQNIGTQPQRSNQGQRYPTGRQPFTQPTGTDNYLDCRMPDEFATPEDTRPLCTGVGPQMPGSRGSPQSPGTHNPQQPGRPQTQPGNPQQTGPQPTAPSASQPGSPSCRQLGERVTPGDRRPLCTASNVGSQLSPGPSQPPYPQQQGPGSPSAPGGQNPGKQPSSSPASNCRKAGERPTIGDTRPICSPAISGGPGNTQPNNPHSGNEAGQPNPETRPFSNQPNRGFPSSRGPTSQTGRNPPGSQPPNVDGGNLPGNQPSSPGHPSGPQRPPAGRQPARGTHTSIPSPHTSGNQPQSPSQITSGRNPSVPGPQTINSGGAETPPTQWDGARRSPGSQNAGPGGQQPAGRPSVPTTRPLGQPLTTQRLTPGRRPTTPTLPRGAPGRVTTSTLSTDDSPRTLFEIVEDPALLIQGRPVKLSKIFELFHKAGLDYILTDPGPYTVFLPSDDAFLRLPKGVVEQLESNPEFLQQVLLFHVTSTEILPTRDEQSFSVPTLQGTPVLVTMLNGGKLILISGSKAVAVTKASNGIFYVINQLMYPLPQDDIVSALQTRPDLSQLSALVELSGLQDILRDNQPYTIFAPTDAAFSQLPEAALQQLMQNTTALRDLLLGHVIEGAHYGREFLVGRVFPNVRGGKLKLQVVSYGYQVNDVNIKTPEIVTGSGVIHVIDGVLLTPQDLVLVNTIGNSVDGLNNPPAGNTGPQSSNFGSRPRTGSWNPTSPNAGNPGHGSLPGSNPSAGSSNQRGHDIGPDPMSHNVQNPSPFGRRSPDSANPSVNHPGTQTQGLTLPMHGPTADGGTGQNNAPQTFTYSVPEHTGVAQLANDIGLHRFATWITNSGLSDKIEDGGTYTVFAPTDAALNSLPPDVAGALDAAPEQLMDLLRYHILPQKITSDSVSNDETASTLLQGKKLRFNVYQDGQVLTALGVPVSQSQDGSSSVRLIVVNRVLQPPSGNLLAVVQASPYLTEFAKAIQDAHLNWMLSEEGSKTVFAPSDTAFQALSDEDRKNMIENRQAFTDLLKRHMVRGTLYTPGFQNGEQCRTEDSADLTLGTTNSGVSVNSVPIVYADIPATNGVIHIIDVFL